MACTLSNKCAFTLFKRTVLLQLVIKNVVTCFFWNTVYIIVQHRATLVISVINNSTLFQTRPKLTRCLYHVVCLHVQRKIHYDCI